MAGQYPDIEERVTTDDLDWTFLLIVFVIEKANRPQKNAHAFVSGELINESQ